MSTVSGPWAVPNTWAWVQAGDVADVIGGGTPPTTESANFDTGTVPWITPADLSGYLAKYIARGRRNITATGLRNSAARILPKGTVLFSSRAPIGYVAIASNPLATNQGFKSYVLTSGLDPEYVYYYLRRAKELALALASGTTFQEISGHQAARIPFPIAPAAEQRRIVAAIESYFTRLDDAVATLERVQRNLKRYRASVLKAAVEGRLVPTEAALARAEGRSYEPASVLLERILAERRRRWEEAELAQMKARGKMPEDCRWKERYKKPTAPNSSDLPELPEGWCWTSLGQLFDVRVGSTPSRSRPEYWNGGIPWASSGEVAFCCIASTKETISVAGLHHSSTQLHPAGTVLLGMIGEGKTRGQAAILNIAACNSQNSAAIRVSDSDLPPEYVYYFLMEQYEVTRTRGSGNNQPALNKARVESIPIPLPPIEEARRIAVGISQQMSVLDSLGVETRRGVLRCARLRQSILKWAFEGRLVDQDPTDEPASVLLERIRLDRERVVSERKKTSPRRRRMESTA